MIRNRSWNPPPMALRKVTLFDHEGAAIEPVDEEGQAKPCVLGVRWLNADTLRTIKVRGGKRTGPHCEPLQDIKPTLDLSDPFIEDLDQLRPPKP
jgi:hypothetical protein